MYDLYSFESGSEGRENIECRYLEARCSRALSASRLPGLDWGLNPYLGCEHACAYCYAPSILHVERGEWGTFVKVKRGIPNFLSKELKDKTGVIGLGTMTDPYQPIERRTKLTRRCLETISRSDARVSIHTKSNMVLRDLDVLLEMEDGEVGITITTPDASIARAFEPHAPPPSMRLEALSELVDNGIDAYALLGPLLPLVIDKDLDDFISVLAGTGIGRVMLDPLRLRPGIMDHLINIGTISDLVDIEEFSRLANSREYFMLVQHEILDLCRQQGMECVSAF